jgi:predicted dehydrogenase
MIKVGVIGTGFIGMVHLEELSRIGGVKVVRVADVNEKLVRTAGAKYNIESVGTDYRDIINDPEIDVIHNCTPNKVHFEVSMKAIEKGKHILTEKPLAFDAKEAEKLFDSAEKKGTVTGINFCYRYYPVVQEAAARIRRGDIGSLRMVTGTWLQDWLSEETDYSWRLEKNEGGASNITGDLGSHWFDLVQFLTQKKVTDVLGDFATLIPVRRKPKSQVLAFEQSDTTETTAFEVQVEDYSSVLFRLGGTVPGSFTACQLAVGRKNDPSFEIFGSDGSFAWNHKEQNKLWIGHRKRPNEELYENNLIQMPESARYASLPAGHHMGYHDAILNLFKSYYSALESGSRDSAEDRPTFRNGYEEMVLLDSIIRSVKSRQWERVAQA